MENRGKLLLIIKMAMALSLLLVPVSLRAATTYSATQSSVDQHVAAPEWFKDAKLGIYFHWGLFSVPNYSSEWYGTYMYNNSSGVSSWHKSHMGNQWGTDSATTWGYDKFATGAKNASGQMMKFAPKLKSAGGAFDPQEYADLLDSAGAWYAGPVIMHHDGWAQWDSKYTEWNAVKKGPNLDLAGILNQAFRKKGMRIVSSFHHAYHMSGFWSGVPKQTNPSLKFFYAQTDSESKIWLGLLNEEESLYHPDVIWHDFNVGRVGSSTVLQHLADYFNMGVKWGKDVVVCYKDGMNDKGEIYDYERNIPSMLVTSRYWETDVSSGSHWNEGGTPYATVNVLHYLIDICSKNGNLLLNFGPQADGTIEPGTKTVLNGMGSWLHKFGETIYCTRAWTVYGEGSTVFGTANATGNSGNFDPKKAGTSSDIRYTISKDGKNLYAIFLGWPSGSRTLKSVTTSSFPVGTTGTVYLYGETPATATKLSFTQSGSGLQVTFPGSAPYSALAYSIKISSIGEAPKACPPKTPLAESDGIFKNALKDSGQLSSINSPSITANNTVAVSSMSGLYSSAGMAHAGIFAPENARGIEIYSLLGKKLFSHSVIGNKLYRFDDFKMSNSQMYFVKFMTK